ncbi:MAG: holo-ACP synthase [Synergistetes bacterium]|nr:holo-ACP synthase [Synergistota bacterium]
MGVDIVRISRFKKLNRRVLERIFTSRERDMFLEGRLESIAVNFAAKEAFIKAFGKLLSWKDIEVLREENGKPCMVLSGRTKALVEEKGLKHIHLSLSHDGDYALAFLILEGVGKNETGNC